MSTSTLNEELELADGSCSITDIQDYSEYVLKKRREKKQLIIQ